MRRDQVLQTAIRKNLQRGEVSASAFSAVHQCISAVNITEWTDEQKKEKLIRNLQSFWRGKSEFVDGCKREHIQKIIKTAFGINSDTAGSLGQDIRSFTFKELYLYYCYIERIAKSDVYFSDTIRKWYGEKRKKSVAQKQEEEQLQKKRREEAERKKVEEMSKEQKWAYEICEKQKDMDYFRELDSSEPYSQKEKVIIAGILKEYWKKTGKWEGGKVSKKQEKKISKVKEILAQ